MSIRTCLIILNIPLLALLSAGCSTAPAALGEQHLERKEYIEAARYFEQAIALESTDSESWTGLGLARYLGNVEDALPALRRADSLSAEPGKATFARALLAHRQGFHNEAAQAYDKSSVLPGLNLYRDTIAAIAALLRARSILVPGRPVSPGVEPVLIPNTIAVLPIESPTGDSLLGLVAVGLADFLITDLTHASSLTVVERIRLAEVFDELERSPLEFDAATLGRKGRLLGASLLLDCTLSPLLDGIHLGSRVVRTVDGGIAASGGEEGKMERIFAMEKSLVISILGKLGIELSANERRAILVPQTENILAFFAYCRGLRAVDVLDYTRAAKEFDEAVSLAPEFRRAVQLSHAVRKVRQLPRPPFHLLAVLLASGNNEILEALINTGAGLLEAGFINAGNARRDGPDILPVPPVPQ